MLGFKTPAGLICIAIVVSACAANPSIPTMPHSTRPEDPIRHRLLEVPSWLEVISADFAAAMSDTDQFSRVSRGFYTVFGRHRESGEYFLLVYEGVPWRAAPIEIVEIAPVTASDTVGGAARP
jgi:hypothetical protein